MKPTMSLPPGSVKVLSPPGSLGPGPAAQQHQRQSPAFSSFPHVLPHRHTAWPRVDLSPATHGPPQPCCLQCHTAWTSSGQEHPLRDQFGRGM